MNPGVAASRQSAAIRGNNSQRRSAETPLRGVRFMERRNLQNLEANRDHEPDRHPSPCLPMNPEEHPTPNTEWQCESFPHFGVGCSMLDVRCFPSVQGFQREHFHFGEISHSTRTSEGTVTPPGCRDKFAEHDRKSRSTPPTEP